MGMPTPIALWFCSTLAPWIEQRLLCDEVAATGLLDMNSIHRTLDEHTSGRYDRSLDLWKMLNLTAWWRLFIEQDLREPEALPSPVTELVSS